MDEGYNSEDEVFLLERYNNKGAVDTQGVKTHFWLEQTYIDEEGIEQRQDEQQIRLKLWLITKFVNLAQVQKEFPDVPWKETIRG